MNYDPLFVCNPKISCPTCQGDRDRFKRKGCTTCNASGYMPVHMNGFWSPQPGFLVAGGPSVRKIDYERLRERGIVSMGINQVSAMVPVTAWTFGDPAEKFHHGLHFDPKCLTFSPLGKLRHPLNVKLPDGSFRKTEAILRDCPGTFGFSRDSIFDAATFLTSTYAHWGGRTLEQEAWAKAHPKEEGPKHAHVLCSMLLGVRLLHYLGCPRIYLLGVDLWMTNDQPYAFEQKKDARNGRYKDENQMLRDIRPVCEASGMKIYNCNPESKCDAFEFVSFEDALEDCRGAVPQEPFDTAQWYEKHLAEEQIKQNPAAVPLTEIARLQHEALHTPPIPVLTPEVLPPE